MLLKFIGRLAMLLALLFSLWFILSLLIYRIPSGEAPVVFDGEVQFKFVELGLTNRDIFEGIAGPGLSLVYIDGAPDLYVPSGDAKKMWEENPFVLAEKGLTLQAGISAAPLLFGGFGISRVVSLKRIAGTPQIRK